VSWSIFVPKRTPSAPNGRPNAKLETNRPGVFAVGDVRSGSIKRVASAVGEGAMAVRLVHERRQSSGRSHLASAGVPSAS
jgi:thioredoxin reductase (NADPH)